MIRSPSPVVVTDAFWPSTTSSWKSACSFTLQRVKDVRAELPGIPERQALPGAHRGSLLPPVLWSAWVGIRIGPTTRVGPHLLPSALCWRAGATGMRLHRYAALAFAPAGSRAG